MKEIGICKVLNAYFGYCINARQIFLALILISLLIAPQIAYYAMHRWLQNFAYRVNISECALLSGLAAILIALVTVSFQAIKAALTNPVKV